jgi:hypothetical protein
MITNLCVGRAILERDKVHYFGENASAVAAMMLRTPTGNFKFAPGVGLTGNRVFNGCLPFYSK